MRSTLLFILLFISGFSNAQKNQYELLIHSSHDSIMIGDEVSYSFYVKNNSDKLITVPGAKTSSRGIGDVLTHTYKIFNEAKELQNKRFTCGVGGRDRRILSGIAVSPGDSTLLITKKFIPTEAGAYEIQYVFDFHPNRGIKPNPAPERYKKMNLRRTLNVEVKGLSFKVNVERNQITAEELWNKPVYNSISEALKNPSDVYRLKLTNPTSDAIAQIHQFSNIQDLTLHGGKVDTLPSNIFNLFFRSLNLSVSVKQGITVPQSIQQSTGLTTLVLKPLYALDLSGFEGGSFPELKKITIMSVAQPFHLTLPTDKMPALEELRCLRLNKVLSVPSDFSSCKNLKRFKVDGEDVNYGKELIIPSVKRLNLSSSRSNSVPILSKCENLEKLSINRIEIEELPAHLLEIPNLKKLVINKSTKRNKVRRQLKKQNVEIIRI